jgi:4a-hydroxytetrahydrobiopterin dehydratase
VTWGNLVVTLWTHTVNGLSRNDYIIAAKIDRLA